MKKNNKGKIILIVVMILVMLLIATAIVIISKSGIFKEKVLDGVIIYPQTINYTTKDGVVENNNENVKKGQILGTLEITNVKIIYKDGMSTLTSDILNTKDISNLKLKAVFSDSNSRVLMEKAFEVKDIKADETENISVEVQGNVSNAGSVVYEIVE